MGVEWSRYFDNAHTNVAKNFVRHWLEEMELRARVTSPTAQYLRALFGAKKSGAQGDPEAEARCREATRPFE